MTIPRRRLRQNTRMIASRHTAALPVLLLGVLWCAAAPASGQEIYQPKSGQAGKDVVWVPTPQVLVEKMLDMAEVTPDDLVMDLGSGDGRNILEAARRGARAIGVEYNPEMVELSTRLAREAGLSGKATFVQGDMYEADISRATVLALFLLPANLERLGAKFLALAPGTRIVLNTFKIEAWEPDLTEEVLECDTWCTAYLLIVPARAEGTWTFDGGELTLTQSYQMVSGTVSSGETRAAIAAGRLRGDAIRFTVDDTIYSGRVLGDRIEGTISTGNRQRTWVARRALRIE